MKAVRIILSLLAALFAVLFLVMAMTVPAFAATAPLIAGIACLVAAWLFWPKRRKVTVVQSVQMNEDVRDNLRFLDGDEL